MPSALELANAVLTAGTASTKVAAAKRLTESWAAGVEIGSVIETLCDNPSRPDRPVLIDPRHAKRRRLGTEAGRAALLHAVAHIEFNAIDLAADMLSRFCLDLRIDEGARHDFCSDWISVCADEARHFELVEARMAEMGIFYGDYPAHNGLWEAALATKDNFAARLAIAPLVLEARGLDVTPAMIEKLEAQKDYKSANVLKTIYEEEVRHVAIGRKWFKKVSQYAPKTEVSQFHDLVNRYFKGNLKPPFNHAARTKADLPPEFYMPLTTKS